MKIYILRHAIAVDRKTNNYKDDSQRPLTKKGQQKMLKNAKGMLALGLKFDILLSSPYLRAKETAAIVVQTFKIKPGLLKLTKNLIPEAAFEALIKEINTLSHSSKNILLVGHEPHLSGLISYLLTNRCSLTINFKKGGLCSLIVARLAGPGCASLNWIMTPSQLRKINQSHHNI